MERNELMTILNSNKCGITFADCHDNRYIDGTYADGTWACRLDASMHRYTVHGERVLFLKAWGKNFGVDWMSVDELFAKCERS